jgi:hypothetical protein
MRSGKPLYNQDGHINEDVAVFFKKIGTFSSDIFQWSKSGLPVVNENQLESRLVICKGCEFWNASGFSGTGSCTKCGCSTQAKLRMATSKCPIDKWGPIMQDPQQ